MKFNNPPFMPTTHARQVTRPKEAWAIDFTTLDFADRPLLMLVVDVGTRRPLSATVSLPNAEDVTAALGRLVRQSGCPDQIWIDNHYEFRLGAALKSWAEQHRISITYVPMRMPQMRSLSELILRDLSVFLRDKRFPTLMELAHAIERWRQSYIGAARPLLDVNQ
jgi:transposase InsO family protein